MFTRNLKSSAARPRRSGSVLILVVALLVLLALMGTAFISTTRNERGVAIQNNANTEADLLLQGLVNATSASTVGELYGISAGTSSTVYRPPVVDVGAGSTSAIPFNNYSSAAGTLFLADRTPTVAGLNYQWQQISWPLFINPGTGKYQFDSPFSTTSSTAFYPDPTAISPKNQTSGNTINSVTSASGQVLPTLTIAGTQIIAADTDGDGIADAGLFKLPVSPVDGVTYYGAIRVIDGNSAVNVNTAVSSTTDYAASPAPKATDATGSTVTTAPVGFFPASVGLQSLLYDTSLASTSDFPRAEYFLFHQLLCPIEFPTNPTTALTLDKAYTDYQTQRPDFVFSTLGDILSSQLARRINNPGYFLAGGNTYTLTPFSLNDAAALASGFCIKSSGSSTSDIETWLQYSLTNAAGTTPQLVATSSYSANQFANWYSSNFHYDNEITSPPTIPRMPVRALLTTWNPVADYEPQHYVTRTVKVAGATAATTVVKNQPINSLMLPYDPDLYVSTYTSYTQGEYVKFKSPDPSISNPPYRCYECLTSATTKPPIDPTTYIRDYTDWREESWTATPTKANVNTADFPTLWRAFYNVMADSSLSTTYTSNGDSIPPLPGTTTAVPHDDVTVAASAAAGKAWGPFRDPSRTPATTTPLSACEMLQLRSAIAAINVMDLRDSDDDVTSRTIPLYADPSTDQLAGHAVPAYTATVYGAERQPYISVVSADYDPGSGAAGLSIELYNPTATAMDISNWQVATVTRNAAGITVTSAGATLPAVASGTIIAPGGYVVLQSTAPVANFTPGGKDSATIITVAGMESVVKPGAAATELVILKPRNASNKYTTGQLTPFDNPIDEGSTAVPKLDQMVPVDMIDLAGVMTAGGLAHEYMAYERPHDTMAGGTDDFNWQFVYPGKYTSTAAAGVAKQTGWNSLPAAATSFAGGVVTNSNTASNPTVSTRTANGAGAVFPFAAIQMATDNWIGQNPTTSAAGNKFPFAGFARNGDILKTPFIGAYVVRKGAGTAGAIVAMNSITMDASQADAFTSLTAAGNTTLANAEILDEPIGRFVPLAAMNPNLAVATAAPTYKNSTSAAGVTTVNDPYGWAAKIFDYLDVQVSNDDDFPNVDPRLADGSNVNNTSMPYSSYSTPANATTPKYPDAAGTVGLANSAASTVALPVANQSSADGFANGTFEQSVGKQGLVNINTAPAFVLAQLPGVTGPMATAIVLDRNTRGPFKSIFDLNRVDGGNPTTNDCFYTAGATYTLTDSVTVGTTTTVSDDHMLAKDPGLAGGDFTPGVSASPFDGVRSDFEEKTLMLTRISNLITTRSDTFTCYVLLQGWRNAGTANATLAVQRRAAFILDRTNITASNSKPQMFTVPNP